MALNFPINPTVGQVYTVGSESWKWDGYCWGVAASTATYAPVFIGQFPPPSPIAGDLWWNSSSGKLCLYYSDIDGSQWVSATQIPDVLATVSSSQVVTAFLEELLPYANISAAVGAGLATGQLFRVTGGTEASAIRAVSSYDSEGAPIANPTFTGTVTLPQINFNQNYVNKAAAPTGVLGDTAVIGGKLCFHDGTDWKEITLGSAPA